MKILYDHQVFSFQNYGGISRYFYEIMKRLPNFGVEYELAAKWSNNHYLKQLGMETISPFLEKKEFRGKNRVLYFLNQIVSKRYIKKQNYDLIHPTYYDPYLLPLLKGKPFCLTVHDMIHERFSDQFSSQDKTREHKKKMIKAASQIITVSECTKKDLLYYFDVDEAKVKVIHHGVSALDHFKPLNSALNFPEKYLLFVGARKDSYKNFPFFVRSIVPLLKKYSNWKVLCVGGGGFNSIEKNMMSLLGVAGSFIQMNLSDTDLFYAYKKAAAFVFPSYYEGFGFPILEALQAGCPLYLADASCFPEIAGEAAHYFNPFEEEDLRSVLLPVFEEESRVFSKVGLGYSQCKKYNWDSSVSDLVKIYKKYS